MFERYTERARRVLFFARYEASHLGGSIIESEHLLLGILHEEHGVAGQILSGARLRLDAARQMVGEATAGQPKVATSVEMPLSDRCKTTLRKAADESTRLNSAHIGTEHLLLALLHETESLSARILAASGMTVAAAEAAIAAGARPSVRAQPHIVLVQVTIRPELEAEFAAALLHNARESVRRDRGCLRFDVSQDKDEPTRWVLYEVYDGPDAHAAHRQSPHFLAYDAVASRAVVEKTVSKCAGRHVT
jgi:quinol monooxygenase YgiN